MDSLVIANWKMNGSREHVERFGREWSASGPRLDSVRVAVCPPAPFLESVRLSVPELELGAQDCSSHDKGAFTGEMSADMLREMGCSMVIVGHSERRQYHHETSALVEAKAQQVVGSGMTAVVCVGEQLEQRESGEHEAVVTAQVSESLQGVSPASLVVAYEPVWAIGTGRVATPEQAEGMHRVIRARLEELYGEDAASVPVIYGGSVKPDNAAELFACESIDGALVGGAGLEAASFHGIAVAAAEARRG